MLTQLSVAIVDKDAGNCQELVRVLAGYAIAMPHLFESLSELEHHLAQGHVLQAALVNLDPDAADSLEQLGRLQRRFGTTTCFAMSQLLDAQLLTRSLRLGIRDFIPLPMTGRSLREALERVAREQNGRRRARVLQVVPAVGGCGNTTIASNLAAGLAAAGRKTVLVDLDLVRGSVASAFDLRPTCSFADAMAAADHVEPQFTESTFATDPQTGLKLLTRPELIEETQRITASGCQALLARLGREFEFVVIDSVMSLDPIQAAAVNAADQHLIVTLLNATSTRNAERYVGMLRRMGVVTNHIQVLINRFVKRGWEIAPREVERAVGVEIGATVPCDDRTANEAIACGMPAMLRSPRAAMSRALREYVDGLLAREIHRRRAA